MQMIYEVESVIAERLKRPVDLTLTDNIRSMISFRENRRGGVTLRLHHMFSSAPADVLQALADWINTPDRRPPAVGEYMRRHRDLIRPGQPRDLSRIRLCSQGKIHDLAPLFARLNARYFESRLEMRLTWGRRSPRRRPRTMRLGSFHPETKVITISPRLDRRTVPKYFIEYVLYHEMLHDALGVQIDENGRRHMHTPEFRRLERQFHDYERAMTFERQFRG